MRRIEVVWCEKPDESDGPEQSTNSITFRIAGDWVATDQDQLLMPIVLLARNGSSVDDPIRAVLKQYGGEQILNSMLLDDDRDLEEGSEWTIERTPTRRTIRPAHEDGPDEHPV